MDAPLWMFLVPFVYMLPAMIAYRRDHMNRASILIVNLFFGWTMIGWVVCLAWSVSSNVNQKRGEAT
jgi:hypothetical protein